MRAVVQRVKRASVRLGDELVASIGPGLLVYVGVGAADTAAVGSTLADKIVHLRIFPSDERTRE